MPLGAAWTSATTPSTMAVSPTCLLALSGVMVAAIAGAASIIRPTVMANGFISALPFNARILARRGAGNIAGLFRFIHRIPRLPVVFRYVARRHAGGYQLFCGF